MGVIASSVSAWSVPLLNGEKLVRTATNKFCSWDHEHSGESNITVTETAAECWWGTVALGIHLLCVWEKEYQESLKSVWW